MIRVTRLDSREIVVNAEHVEFVEATPETIISLTTGRKVVVRESVDEVIKRVHDWRHRPLPAVRAGANGS